ncbi:MAG TPA: hypothetical protein VNB29_07125 [Chthoniobacterales bacterium]|nr:hypothetical protein [Chthoniobacterales bacterium]
METNTPAPRQGLQPGPLLSARLVRLRPIEELLLMAVATVLFAIPVYLVSPPSSREFNLCYMLPIVIPFGMFLFDRHRSAASLTRASLLVDSLVIGMSLVRIFISVPYISGHALFLSYAILTTARIWPRLVAGVGLWYTAYDKLSNFGNLWELLGGMLLGIIFALVCRRIPKAPRLVASPN